MDPDVTTKKPLECHEDQCVGEVCPDGTDVCMTDCSIVPHPLFCDCYYFCNGCDLPNLLPCPIGTMFDVDNLCCGNEEAVLCGDRVPCECRLREAVNSKPTDEQKRFSLYQA